MSAPQHTTVALGGKPGFIGQTAQAIPNIGRIAWNTFREALRRKILQILLVFAVVTIASSQMFAYMSPGEELKFILDMSLGAMRLFGMLIAVMLGAYLIPTEVERKTIHVILAKPLRRADFLFGKYLGALLTVLINVALMAAVFFLVFMLKARNPEFADQFDRLIMLPNLFKAVLLIMLEMTIITAIAVTFSTVSSSVFTVVVSFFLYFTGHLSSFLKHRTTHGEGGEGILPAANRILLDAVATVVPHYEMFDVRQAFATGVVVAPDYVLRVLLYALVYTVVVVGLIGYVLFNQKEF
jgi:Cu-processing system permease protein